MKAVLRIAIAAVSAAIAFSSCENLNDEYISVSDEIVINALVAEQSVETRSAIDVFGSEKVTYTWLAGDAISVFFGDSEGSIFVTDVTASKAQFKVLSVQLPEVAMISLMKPVYGVCIRMAGIRPVTDLLSH